MNKSLYIFILGFHLIFLIIGFILILQKLILFDNFYCKTVTKDKLKEDIKNYIKNTFSYSSPMTKSPFLLTAIEAAQAAAAADEGCPFSTLIKASATVTIDATLEEDEE